MKISELPKEIRKKALYYRKKENTDLGIDKLSDAFNWTNTKEGFAYWYNWNNKKNYDSNGVTQPKQYQIGIDTFARAESNLTKEEILAICKFNIDKYCWRKKDQDKEDFKKIIDYANWAIKNL